MSSNIGQVTYGNLSLLPGYDTSSSGFGDLTISGKSLVMGSSLVSGTFSATGSAILNSTLTVTGTSTFNGQVNFGNPVNFTGRTNITNTEDSTGLNSGALQVAGGASINKSVYIGDNLTVLGSSNVQNNLIVSQTLDAQFGTINSTVNSTSAATGALQVKGGVSILKDLRIDSGNLYLANNLALSTSTATGETFLASAGNNLFINKDGIHSTLVNQNSTADFNVSGTLIVNSNSGVKITTTLDASTPLTAALVVSGGASFARSVLIGGSLGLTGNATVSGIVSLTNTTQSTSPSSGGLIVSSGVGIQKNLYVNGILDIAATSNTSWINAVSVTNSANDLSTYISSSSSARTAGSWQTLKFVPVASTTPIISITSTGLTIDQTTASTVLGTGALQVHGGTSILGDLIIGQTSTFTGVAKHLNNTYLNGHAIYFQSSADDALVFSTDRPILYGSQGGILGTSPTTQIITWDNTSVHITCTKDATSASDAALVVAGGAAFGKSIHTDRYIYMQNTSFRSTGDEITINANGSSITLANTFGLTEGSFVSSPLFFTFKSLQTGQSQSQSQSSSILTIDKTDGHVSVANNLSVGGTTLLSGNVTIAAVSTSFTGTVQSTSPSTGGLTIASGVGILRNVNIGGSVTITSNVQSSSSSTGCLVLSGGLASALDFYLGGSANVGANLSVLANSSLNGFLSVSGPATFGNTVDITGATAFHNTLLITDTTASTTATSGSVIIKGGLGLSGNMNCLGYLQTTNTSSTSIKTLGGIELSANLTCGGDAHISGSLIVSGNISSTGGVLFTNTIDSTSATSGSVVISGGLGVYKAVYIGSSNALALVVSGGLDLGKDAILHAKLKVQETAEFTTTTFDLPTFTTRTSGSRIILKGEQGTNSVDYAIGLGSTNMWCSVPTTASTYSWYAGISEVFTLSGLGSTSQSGNMNVNGSANVVGAVTLQNTLNVSNTTYFGAAVTAMSNLSVAGVLVISNTAASTSSTSGALTTPSLGVRYNTNIGGTLNVTGNTIITGDLTTQSHLNITSTGANSVSTLGGLQVAKDTQLSGTLNVLGSTVIGGNLTVSGTTTTVNSTTLTTAENVILLNSAPAGTAYAGISAKRYQVSNDQGLGDIVNGDTPIFSGMSMSQGTTSSIMLNVASSLINDTYNGYWLYIYAGTGSGQVRRVKSYSGQNHTATIYANEDNDMNFSTVADATSAFHLYNVSYAVAVYDDINHEWSLAGTPLDPSTNQSFPLVKSLNIRAGNAKFPLINTKTINGVGGVGTEVDIEAVNFNDRKISNLTLINGNQVDVTSTVSLVDNDVNGAIMIPGTKTHGAYWVLVSSVLSTGSVSSFTICANDSRSAGSVSRLVNATGANNEHLTISWAVDDYPHLRFMNLPTNGTGALVDYKVRVTSVI